MLWATLPKLVLGQLLLFVIVVASTTHRANYSETRLSTLANIDQDNNDNLPSLIKKQTKSMEKSTKLIKHPQHWRLGGIGPGASLLFGSC